MFNKTLSLLLCLISILFINNPALAIEKNQTIIDTYKPELRSYINLSEPNEPLYLARERKNIDLSSNEMSLAWLGSILIPGLGEVLLGEVWRGLLFFGASLTGILLIIFNVSNYSDKARFAIMYGIIVQIASVLDAYFIAKVKYDSSDEESILLNERITLLEETFKKVSIENNQINYSLTSF